MSEKDKLDIFMESQRDVNLSNTETLKALAVTVADLEKHSVKMAQLVEIVNIALSDIKANSKEIADLKLSSGFVKDAKWVFRAIVLALIVGTGGLIWELVKQEQPKTSISKADIELIINTVREKN